MGPRSCDRGNSSSRARVTAFLHRFNGAAILRSRKSEGSTRALARRRGFNGAAILRSRKLRFAIDARPRTLKLQWGRDLAIAEMLT